MWFLTLSTTTHMLQVKNRRVTAGLYLCECTQTTRQLYQHTSVLSLYWADPGVLRLSHSRTPPHQQVQGLSQHASYMQERISEVCEDAYRCQERLNQFLTGSLHGYLICASLCQGFHVKQNTLTTFSTSTSHCFCLYDVLMLFLLLMMSQWDDRKCMTE